MVTMLGPYELNTIITGDARELARAIPDESVDLIFTDPIYDRIDDYRWLAETAARVLKPNSAALVWEGQQWLANAMQAMNHGELTYRWLLGWYASNNMQMVGMIGRNLAPLMWFEKGHSNPKKAFREVKESPIPDGNSPFKWAKRLDVVAYYLERFTNHDSIVFDSFTGGGTVPAVCKMLGRNYLAFEIDPDVAERARQRVAQTQPPLFVLQPKQQVMNL